ncbi:MULTISPECIES: hypothetical protein [Mesorhizobium]|uniref:hypothetical protein n=1 Tax=Mesorhizobium TaxID=68287 RepID=UPI000A825B24|nr:MULTISPECIES: hypothetical protein [Mesorhizobium]MUT27256.1 hypothetical protein [Mesorhizobium japonicum]
MRDVISHDLMLRPERSNTSREEMPHLFGGAIIPATSLNGKLSALRWMMGDDWDMLDT